MNCELTNELLDDIYAEVLEMMDRGEPVPVDVLANLEAEGYVFNDGEAEDDGVSPNEVRISFTDYAHDTTVDVTVDSDGDIWLRDPTNLGGDSILLSRVGAERLLEILAEVLDYEVVE